MNFSSVEAGYTPISVPGLLTKAVNEAANLCKYRGPTASTGGPTAILCHQYVFGSCCVSFRVKI